MYHSMAFSIFTKPTSLSNWEFFFKGRSQDQLLFYLSIYLSIYLFIYLWLCWVFVSVRGLSLVAARGGHSSSQCAGLSLSRPLLLRRTGSRRAGSAIVAHGPSCSAACGIFPDQGSNPCPLHGQADFQPLRHQGNPRIFLTLQKETPYPSVVTPHSPCPQLLVTTFCLYRFAYSGHLPILDMLHMVFCLWLLSLNVMFSRFIHIVAHSIPHSLLWLNNINYMDRPHDVYPLTSWWTIGLFLLFG